MPSKPIPEGTTFEELLPFIEKQIDARRYKWTLTTMEWCDARQEMLIRVFKKFALYDAAKGPFEHWLNRLISNAFTNLLRDHCLRWQRPCIRDGGCVYNLGGDHCAYTPSGLQCSECPLLKAWKEKKEPEYNVRASLTLEHHAQEVSSLPQDSTDIEAAKKVIDQKMLSRLGAWDRRIYRLLYVDHLSPLDAVTSLKTAAAKRKRPLGPEDAVEYQDVLKVAKMMRDAMKRVILEEDLA